MAELHPFFVHFPIALLTAAVAFEFLGVLRPKSAGTMSAYILQILAAVSAILAAVSGQRAEMEVADSKSLFQSVEPLLTQHTSWGNAMIWVIIGFVIIRTYAILEQKSWAQTPWLFPFASLVLAAMIIFTGLWGGELSRGILSHYMLN